MKPYPGRPTPAAGPFRRLAPSMLLAIGASMVLLIAVWAGSVGAAAKSPPGKQAILQQMAAQATAAAKGPRAAKQPNQAPIQAPIQAPGHLASCPQPLAQPGLFIGDTGGFHERIVNGAVIAPTSARPFEYILYAGALRANPQQGMVIVLRLVQDPCAPGAGSTQVRYFKTPFQQGAVTLTSLQGDTVGFTSASGSSGRFNYVTGQFAYA
jgi:hypothetical protein